MLPSLPFTASLPQAVFAVVADAAVKGTVALVLALVLDRILRRGSAATRHLLWALTLVGLLALPVLSLVLPRWHVGWPEAGPISSQNSNSANNDGDILPAVPGQNGPASDENSVKVLVLTDDRARERPAAMPHAAGENEAPVARGSGADRWKIALFWIWLGGAGVSLAWLLAGFIHLTLLAHRCRDMSGTPLAAKVQALAWDLGIRRPVRVLQAAAGTMPMTWGIRRPTLLLPQEAADWPADKLRMVLIHELGHVLRCDCLTQVTGFTARGLFWFHPLVWWAASRLRCEQESACDDLVLREAPAADYSRQLLALTAKVPVHYLTLPLALAMARPIRLERRLAALLDSRRSRRPVHSGAVLGGSALALAVLIPLASFGPPSSHAAVKTPIVVDPRTGGSFDSLKKLAEVQAKLKRYFVAPLDDQKLADAALKGLLEGLNDPYTVYLPPELVASAQQEIKGVLTGIGAQLKLEGKRIKVLSPLEDSPALEAGLRPGDIIEAVDGRSSAGLGMKDVIARIIGPSGTQVKLRVTHEDGRAEELSITRRHIRVPSVQGFGRGRDGRWIFFLDPDRKIACVRIHQFSSTTGQEVKRTITELLKQGMRGLLLDLRSCPGGLLEQAIEVAKLFIAQGDILTLRGPGPTERTYKADGKTLGDFPMAVLVNEHTASSAEIVAGTLQDHGRAVLIGTRTFGKGSVQTIVDLEGGGALRVTSAYHYLPSGRNIQKRPSQKSWGVEPSDGFHVFMSSAEMKAMCRQQRQRGALRPNERGPIAWENGVTALDLEEKHADPQLAAALRSMTARLTGGAFIKTGQSLADLRRLDDMRSRRQEILKRLESLERDILELETRRPPPPDTAPGRASEPKS
jgi:carboxyl-terminal processing protease